MPDVVLERSENTATAPTPVRGPRFSNAPTLIAATWFQRGSSGQSLTFPADTAFSTWRGERHRGRGAARKPIARGVTPRAGGTGSCAGARPATSTVEKAR